MTAAAATVWQIVAAGDPPGYYHITPITGTREAYIVYRANITRDQATYAITKEVQAGQECGMAFENYQDMRAGDVIECYRVETIQRSL